MQKYKTVSDFLNDLSKDKKAQVLELQTLIKNIDKDLQESIKWNAPSYVINGEDRITFNINIEGTVKLILHMGTKRKENKKTGPIMNDDSGLIQWNSDIRGFIIFQNLEDVYTKKENVAETIKTWLAIEV